MADQGNGGVAGREQVSAWRSRGGEQGVYTHASAETGTAMTFSVYVPDHVAGHAQRLNA